MDKTGSKTLAETCFC